MTDIVENFDVILYGLAFVLGAAIGSFLNVVAYRLPKILFDQEYRAISSFLIEESEKPHRFLSGIRILDRLLARSDATEFLKKEQVLPAKGLMYLSVPASSCPNCGHKIRAYENIPVLGWLMLRGKCSGCHTRISCQYPLVEFVTGLLTLGVIYVLGFTVEAALFTFFVWVLIALTLIDLHFYILPDLLTLPLMWLGLILSYFGLIPIDFHSAFMGVIIGYLSLWTINQIALLLLKKDGIGNGDFKLLAMIGAWQGMGNLFNVILISSILGAIIGVVMLLKRQGDNRYIPYGPFLALASIIILLLDIQPESFFNLI